MAGTASDRRREQLLAVAARVFAEKGYHPTTMRDLARATGLSLAGIYHYVSSKDELLFLVQERCFAAVLRGAEVAVAGASEPEQRLRRFIEHHVTFFARHMSEMKVLSHEADSLSPVRARDILGLKRRYVDSLEQIIRGAMEGRGGRLDPSVASYALFGMMNWIYNWYHPAGLVSPEALAEQFASIFLEGLMAPSAAAVAEGG